VAVCWLEDLSVEMGDGVGIGFPMGRLITIGDRAVIQQ